MTNNIFENAKFGDKFITRGGETVIFIECNRIGKVTLIAKPQNCIYSERTVNMNGRLSNDETILCDDDVILRKTTPVDIVRIRKFFNSDVKNQPYNNLYVCDADSYEAGYRKAIEL